VGSCVALYSRPVGDDLTSSVARSSNNSHLRAGGVHGHEDGPGTDHIIDFQTQTIGGINE